MNDKPLINNPDIGRTPRARDAFSRGRDAYYDQNDHNPYPSFSLLGRQWAAGHEAAQQELINDPDVREALTRHT